ncbi:MAG: response regulator [Anaerolineales bacterium]|nr:response regulator [Anaerolineales bacterium]MCB9430798.1 response regulator [Ardenticatenaceae bacterium]
MTTANVLNLQQDGIAAARAGNKPLARRLLLEASLYDPNNKSVWLWLAVVATTPDETVKYLHRALALSPGNEQILAALRQAEGRLAQQQETAVWHCPLCDAADTEAHDRCPRCRAVLTLTDFTVLLENHAVDNRRLQTAVSQLQQAVEHDPDDVRVHYKLALAHLNMRETALGLRHLQTAQRLQPDNKFLQTAVADLQAELQRQAPPAWMCPLCLTPADQPSDPCPNCHAILTLSDIDSVIHNSSVNRDCLESVAQRLTQEAAALNEVGTYYKLALAQLNLGRVDRGIEQLNIALQLQPDNRAIRALVTVLLQRQADAEVAKNKQHAPAPQKGVILVVDDSPTIRKLVSMTLEEAGYSVVVAADGMQALGKLNGHSSELNGRLPNLILLDITMPRMDGYQVCKIIKGYKETKGIPIVMLSGKDGFFDRVRGRMAGSTDYITKPFKAENLVEAVSKHIKRD